MTIFTVHKHTEENGSQADIIRLYGPDADAWDLLDMLDKAFPNLKRYLVHYDGYENAVAIFKDN